MVHDHSFLEVLILDRPWPVWSRCKMTCFCYTTGTTTTGIYSVHEHDFESSWLWDANNENSHFPLPIFWQHLTLITFVDFIFPVATNSSVCIQNQWKWYSVSTTYKSKPDLRKSSVNADYFYPSEEIIIIIASCTLEFAYDNMIYSV